jgi:peptidoglycan/xylan/chitin deacetylase (PgdA/CDA1 family)
MSSISMEKVLRLLRSQKFLAILGIGLVLLFGLKMTGFNATKLGVSLSAMDSHHMNGSTVGSHDEGAAMSSSSSHQEGPIISTTAPPAPTLSNLGNLAEPVKPQPTDIITAVPTNGMVPVFYQVETNKPVVFLTIDDGSVKDPAAISFMKQRHLIASLFLNDSKISDNYPYFKELQSAGNPIENHTVNHHDLTKLSYAQQKKEICDNADKFATVFGRRPKLFRPPYGAFNNDSRRAAADCGMTALIHWHAKANGGSMQYQRGDKLQPGDIVLMHFRKEVVADLTAFTEAAQKAKLQTVLLEDWIR